MHGTADPVVPYANASARPQTFGRRNESCSATDTQAFLASRGAPSYLEPIPDAGHVPAADLYVAPWNITLWGFVIQALDLQSASVGLPATATRARGGGADLARRAAPGDPSAASLRERTAAINTGDLLFVRPPLNDQIGIDAGILDTGNATIWWLREHGVEVDSNLTVTHVAMAMRDQTTGELLVVQAIPPAVTTTPADVFFQNITGVEYFHGVIIDPAVRSAGRAATSIAAQQFGKPYADAFQPPSSGKFYCSSLVEYAYQHALSRSDPVFTQQTFDLLFVPLDFWEKYYASMNLTLPTNEPGSNPTLLLHSAIVNFTKI
jgi:cell wall-associated NlpC family hydrolase